MRQHLFLGSGMGLALLDNHQSKRPEPVNIDFYLMAKQKENIFHRLECGTVIRESSREKFQ